MPLARSASHRPLNTCPHRQITKSHQARLKWFRLTIFARRKSRKSGSQSAAAETKTAFRFVVAHWCIYRTFRFCRGQNHKRAKRAVGGCQCRDKGSKINFRPLMNPVLSLLHSDIAPFAMPKGAENLWFRLILARNFPKQRLDLQSFTSCHILHY